MKKLFKLSILLFVALFSASVYAQAEERNKIVLTINSGGKNITAELSTVSFGLSRYADYTAPVTPENKTATAKDKTVTEERGAYSLVLMIKKVDTEMLKLFSKKATRFNGTIVVTDTYGKNPPREIKFTKAALESYQDQFTSAYYDDSYSSSSVMINCAGLTINGVVFE
jgi:hypothetical protein